MSLVAPIAPLVNVGSQMQEVWGSNPRLGGLGVSHLQASGGISALQSEASGLQSTMQGNSIRIKKALQRQSQQTNLHLHNTCALPPSLARMFYFIFRNLALQKTPWVIGGCPVAAVRPFSYLRFSYLRFQGLGFERRHISIEVSTSRGRLLTQDSYYYYYYYHYHYDYHYYYYYYYYYYHHLNITIIIIIIIIIMVIFCYCYIISDDNTTIITIITTII